MSQLYSWIDKIFVTIYLTNGSNHCLLELIRFFLFQLYFLSCLVRAELDLFKRLRELFRLDYLVGWISLQIWVCTPAILTILHARMNQNVIGLVRDMKRLYVECGVPENVLRVFAWKMFAVQITLSGLLIFSTAHHLSIVQLQWTVIDVSCIVPCAWFSHIPLLQLLVWMCSLGFLYGHTTSAVLRMHERFPGTTTSISPAPQIRQLKKFMHLVNTLLEFKDRVAKTYENSLMLYVLCCLGCIIYLTYHCIFPGGEVFILKAVQWLLCLFLTCLVPGMLTDKISRFVTRLTKISETLPYTYTHTKVHHFLTRMLHEERSFRLHEHCRLNLNTFLRIISGALAYIVIQYQLRPSAV